MLQHVCASNEVRQQDSEYVKTVCLCACVYLQHNHCTLCRSERKRGNDEEKAAAHEGGWPLNVCLRW